MSDISKSDLRYRVNKVKAYGKLIWWLWANKQDHGGTKKINEPSIL